MPVDKTSSPIGCELYIDHDKRFDMENINVKQNYMTIDDIENYIEDKNFIRTVNSACTTKVSKINLKDCLNVKKLNGKKKNNENIIKQPRTYSETNIITSPEKPKELKLDT